MNYFAKEALGIPEEQKNFQEREALRKNPEVLPSMIAEYHRQGVPYDRQKKLAARPTLEKVESLYPSEDPRHLMGRDIYPLAKDLIEDPEFAHVSPSRIVKEVYATKLASKEQEIHRYVQHEHTNFMGLLPNKNVVPLPTYDTWRQTQGLPPAMKYPSGEDIGNIAAEAAIATGVGTGAKILSESMSPGIPSKALELVSRVAGWLGPKMVTTGAKTIGKGGLPVAIAGTATAAIGALLAWTAIMAGGEIAGNKLDTTEWAQARTLFPEGQPNIAKLPQAGERFLNDPIGTSTALGIRAAAYIAAGLGIKGVKKGAESFINPAEIERSGVTTGSGRGPSGAGIRGPADVGIDVPTLQKASQSLAELNQSEEYQKGFLESFQNNPNIDNTIKLAEGTRNLSKASDALENDLNMMNLKEKSDLGEVGYKYESPLKVEGIAVPPKVMAKKQVGDITERTKKLMESGMGAKEAREAAVAEQQVKGKSLTEVLKLRYKDAGERQQAYDFIKYNVKTPADIEPAIKLYEDRKQISYLDNRLKVQSTIEGNKLTDQEGKVLRTTPGTGEELGILPVKKGDTRWSESTVLSTDQQRILRGLGMNSEYMTRYTNSELANSKLGEALQLQYTKNTTQLESLVNPPEGPRGIGGGLEGPPKAIPGGNVGSLVSGFEGLGKGPGGTVRPQGTGVGTGTLEQSRMDIFIQRFKDTGGRVIRIPDPVVTPGFKWEGGKFEPGKTKLYVKDGKVVDLQGNEIKGYGVDTSEIKVPPIETTVPPTESSINKLSPEKVPEGTIVDESGETVTPEERVPVSSEQLSLAKQKESQVVQEGEGIHLPEGMDRNSPEGIQFLKDAKEGISPDIYNKVTEGTKKILSGSKREKQKENMDAWFKGGSLVGLASLGVTSILDFITLKEAEAANIPTTLRVAPYAVKFVEGAIRAMKGEEPNWRDAIKVLDEAGLVGAELDPINPKKVLRLMNGINTVPNINELAYKGRGNVALNLASGQARGDFLLNEMGPNNEARRMMSPQPILAYELNVRIPENVRACLEAVDNTMGDVIGGESHAKEVIEAMRPLQEKYGTLIRDRNVYNAQNDMYDEIMTRELKRLEGMTGPEREAQEAFLDNISREKSIVANKLKEIKPHFDSYLEDWESTVKPLAEKYPSSRVAFAVEGEGLNPDNPWMAKILTQEERTAAGYIKEINDIHTMRMMNAGMPVILDKPYMHHALHPAAKADISEVLKGLSPNADENLFMAAFRSRMRDSKQMVPDVQHIMKDYLYDANKRIGIAEFWKDGQKGGWKDFWQQAERLGFKGVSDYMESINKAFVPYENTSMNKAMKIYYAFETARLIGASVSTAFKHAIKLEANWSNFGIKESAKIMPTTINIHLRNVGRDLADKLHITQDRAGLTKEVIKTYTGTNRLMELITDVSLDESPKGWSGKVLDKMNSINEYGGAFINFTERFDRVHSMLASLDMAAKNGMTAQQAAYGVMDTILKNNFLSGIHNPSWLRNPSIRTMMMFQGTPFKILEQRVLLALRGGTAIKEGLKETWNQLQNLKGEVKEGENRFKFNLIKDAFNSQKDIYGISNAGQLMRKMMILGTILVGGKQLFGVDMMEHVLHIPGFKRTESSLDLNVNPVVSAALKAKSGPHPDDYWLSSFFANWLPSGPIPAVILKGQRLSKDDIPDRYKGSQFRYLFGIPSVKDAD